MASPAWPAPITTAVVRTRRGAPCEAKRRYATSTVTLVGLVMMS